LTDGGSDTDIEKKELTTHSSNTGCESEYYDCEKPASTGMTGDVTITNDHDNTVILNEQTVVDSSTNEQIKEKINCTLCTNTNSEFISEPPSVKSISSESSVLGKWVSKYIAIGIHS
jgi:hypothetical protein